MLDAKKLVSRIAINAPYSEDDHSDYFKFAFVRNPWDRVVSCYSHKVVQSKAPYYQPCRGKDFEAFVDFIDRTDLSTADSHIRPQVQRFPVEHVDFIGRFEHFERDLTHVLRVLGISNPQIAHKNASRHKHYSRYYTERTREIIARKYKEDIEAFGYEFEAH